MKKIVKIPTPDEIKSWLLNQREVFKDSPRVVESIDNLLRLMDATE